MADFNPLTYDIGDFYPDINVTPSGGWRYDGGDGTVTIGFRDGTTIVVDQSGKIIYKG